MANEYVVILSIPLILLCAAYALNRAFECHISDTSVCKAANLDTIRIGQYDPTRTPITVYNYCLGVMAYAEIYKKLASTPSSWKQYFLQWISEACHDELGYVLEGVTMATTEFETEMDLSEREKRQPKFNVSADFDLDCIPKSSWFNYYYNLEELSDRIKKDFVNNEKLDMG